MLPGDAPGQEEFRSSETPPPLIWTGYYYRDAAVVAQAAQVLGLKEDAERYALLAERIKKAFNDKWLDPATGQYSTGSQTANAFPLALGVVPEEWVDRVVHNLVVEILEKRDAHLRTGNTGTTCLIDALAEHGQGELLYRVATQTTYPGWGYMVAEGATTIWESWSLASTVGAAESMIMWATIDEFFYNDLAGIVGPEFYGPRQMAPGFREVSIRPRLLGDLQYARASIRTVRGVVRSSWQRGTAAVKLDVTIPVNSQARVSVPKVGSGSVTVTESSRTVWENGRFVDGVPGIAAGAESDESVTFDVGSGSYSFESSHAADLAAK
jgi:alpha-L-rhamnosidase